MPLSVAKAGVNKVSVLVLSWNGLKHLEVCLPALREQQDPGVEWDVCLLDNGSYDKTVSWVKEHHPWVRLMVSEVNLGFCAGNNRLVSEADDADAVVLLNNDTRPNKDWLRQLVAGYRAAAADVAAVSGGIVDWQAERLDFGRGVLTFDGHAFQQDYRRPLDRVDLPQDGSELLFACGGNMMIDRAIYRHLGGFDPSYFAYLEDVDLGWRLWAAGYRVTYAPKAVVRHRSMATSQALGNANRGFLFEKNAFATAYKNFDDEFFRALMPAVWMTLSHRNQTLLVQNNPGGDLLTLDPYAGLIANTAAPESEAPEGTDPAAPGDDPEAAPSRETGRGSEPGSENGTRPTTSTAGGPVQTSLKEKWQGYGAKEFVRRALRKGARMVLPGWLFEDSGPTTRIIDPRTFAQLQATTYVLGRRDQLADSRRRVQAMRVRSDREIFERFPLAVVPTYPGDEDLFGSRAFRDLLPDDLPLEHKSLAEVMELD